MGRGSVKRFAERHGARTFKLVPRSLAGDAEEEGGPERVFVEVTPGAERRMLNSLSDAFVDVENDFEYEEEYEEEEDNVEDDDSNVGEAAKYGILYDDRHYDYTKHLKTVGAVPGGVIVAAPVAPKVGEEDFWRELKDLDTLITKDLREVVDDPAVLEVLEALEDEAYIVEEDFQDDLVDRLEGYTIDSEDNDDDEDEYIDVESPESPHKHHDNTEEELQKILQDMDDTGSQGSSADDMDAYDAELIKSVAKMEEPELFQTTDERKAAQRKMGYAQVDEIRRALREDGGGLKRMPTSDLSDFDSDEYFKELEEESDDNLHHFLPSNPKPNNPNQPQVINVIHLNNRTGLPSRRTVTPPSSAESIDSMEVEKANLGASRKRDETPEEKKARKAAVKAARKERRGEKKENREMFK